MLKPNDKRIDIRMPTELAKEAKDLAYTLNMKFSQFVRIAINEKIERQR